MQNKEQNKQYIKEALVNRGIKNPLLIDSILAVIGKESNYQTIEENLNYTAPRIKQVFKSVNDGQAKQLANNPQALANFVYGKKGGNTAPGDGYKYRGRAFNQITFKNTYKLIGEQIGKDLVNNPELLNEPKTGALATAQFFKNGLISNRQRIIDKYGIDILNIKPNENPNTILKIATNLNAGLGASPPVVENEYKKALKYFAKSSVTNVIPLLLIAGALLYYYSSNPISK